MNIFDMVESVDRNGAWVFAIETSDAMSGGRAEFIFTRQGGFESRGECFDRRLAADTSLPIFSILQVVQSVEHAVGKAEAAQLAGAAAESTSNFPEFFTTLFNSIYKQQQKEGSDHGASIGLYSRH